MSNGVAQAIISAGLAAGAGVAGGAALNGLTGKTGQRAAAADAVVEESAHALPRWVATKGPRPYFVAEHWGLAMSIVTAVVVFVNTVVLAGLPTPTTSEWINATMAWLAALALWLKDRQPNVNKVAAWREKVRAEEAAKKAEEQERLLGDFKGDDPPLPYRVHHVDAQAAETAIEGEEDC